LKSLIIKQKMGLVILN